MFSITKKIKSYTALFAVSIENLKNLKYHTSQKKTVFSIICTKKMFKEEESIEILKILGLIENI